jgi:glycosyltransferase involved in cell wall biosynthesis
MIRTRGRAVRKILSYAPLLGLVPHPAGRPQGITAVVRVKNEEEWIEPCLLSVSDAVDELVVVDNGSTDRTPEILARLHRALAPKVKLFCRPELDHVDLSNFAMAQATYRWALKWDGDFVARTTGPYAITRLRERILSLPAHRHFHVRLTCIELMGDLWHQCPGWELRREPFTSVLSPALRFVRVVRVLDGPPPGWPCILRDPRAPFTIHFEDVKVPLYYDVARWDEPYFFHLQVKPPLRMYLRDCWADWAENPELQGRFADLEAYALDRAQRAWNVRTLQEAAELYMARVRDLLVPYAVERFGEHPQVLKPYLETSRRP